jgi:hypothetical protein
VIWQLRYRAASSSAYKWEFVGGSALYNEVVAVEAKTGTTYTDLTTVGPQITLPLGGDYDVTIGAGMYATPLNTYPVMSYQVGATAAVDNDEITVRAAGVNVPIVNAARTRRKTGLATATALVAKYKVAGGTTSPTVTFQERFMSALPVRVG